MLERVALDGLIGDEAGLALLTPSLLEAMPFSVVPNDAAWRGLSPELQDRTFSLEATAKCDGNAPPAAMEADELAYIVFTSGPNGVPKGVMVPCPSLGAYPAAVAARKR